jgi:two-component system, NarL family, sensor histidine kinase FusK
MGKPSWKSGWAAHVFVAVAYLLMYSVDGPLTVVLWPYRAALRLTCLLLLPYRYWPALVVGDLLGLAILILPDQLLWGDASAALNMISPIAMAMPIVWWCRSRLNLFPGRHLVNLRTLLLCCVLLCLEWGTINALGLAFSTEHTTPHSILYSFFALTLAKYIVMLSFLPWVLVARIEYLSQPTWRLRLRGFADKFLTWDALVVAVLAVAFAWWLRHHSHAQAQRLSLLAVFLPILWMTLRPGWRSAALGGTPAIACVGLLLSVTDNLAMVIKAQAFLAVTMTCLFALGVRITAQREQEEQDRLAAEQAIQLARQNIQLNEARLRKTAQALEFAGSTLNLSHHQLLTRFSSMLPVNEAQRYYRQATATQNQVSQLADSMHPAAWRQRGGLPAALRETIARALKEVGVAYGCTIEGRGLMDLTSDVQTAIYRLACESVAYVNAQMVCSRVHVRLRGGITGQVYWAALRVEGVLEPAYINDAVYDTSERQFLASKLGAHGLGPDALRNHVRLFAGELRERITARGVQLTYLLVDPSTRHVERTAAINPWVT